MKKFGSKLSVILTPDQEAECNKLLDAEREQKPRLTPSDLTRELISIGLYMKKQPNQKTEPKEPLTKIEEEILFSLYYIISEREHLTKDMIKSDKSQFKNINELRSMASRGAGKKLESFLEELKNNREL